MKAGNTKELILEAALDLFSQHGFAGASIRQIAGAVGIRESAVYNHFKSKEEIFFSLLSRFKKNSLSDTILSDDLIEDLPRPEKFLNNFSKKLINLWSRADEKKFMRLILMEQFTVIGQKEISPNEFLNESHAICRMIFSEMMKHGFFSKHDPEILADEFIAPLYFIRIEHLSSEKEDGTSTALKLAEKHVAFFWKAVRA